MSDVACSNFTQHAWKQDLCSDCHKPRDKHTCPVPAKRPVKTPGAENGSNGTAEEGEGSGGGRAQKPEARVKPTIASKPDGVKPGSPDLEAKGRGRPKPALIGVKPNVAPKTAAKPQRKDVLNQVQGKGVVEDGGIYGHGNVPPADGAYDDVPHPVPVPQDASHYYSKYDVTFKGMSGKPAPIGTHVRNKSLDRLKNDIEIVMPYNVVDVSTDPPVNDPDNPPPGSPTGKNGAGRGRHVSPLTQQDSPGGSPMSQRKEASSPQFRRNIRILENAMQAGADSRAPPGQKDDQGRTKKSPFQSPVSGRRALVPGADLYEDVEDPEDVAVGEEKFTRNTPGRSSIGKSSVFEAKLSTIAQNLDLHKKTTGKQPPPPPPMQLGKPGIPQAPEPPGPSTPTKKEKKKTKEEVKPEKQRKGSVGKSFFKKLFGRSGGDSEDNDAPAELTVSVDSDTSSLKADDASSTKSSTPGSVEGSPLMSNVRHSIDQDKKEPAPKKVTRVESVKEPALFSAELRQAVARSGSKLGEKNISGTVTRLRDTKREEALVHDTAFAELKGSPLFERRFQQRTYDTIDGDDGEYPPPKPVREESKVVRSEGKAVRDVVGPGTCVPPQQVVRPEALEPPPSPAQSARAPGADHPPPAESAPKETAPRPQVAAKPDTKVKPETKAKPKLEAPPKPDAATKPEMPDSKPKTIDTGTIKRRPAPAAPPPPAPMDAPANRRSTTCTSPVSPRPSAPPPPSPKFPEPPPEEPPKLPEKTGGRKRDSLQGEELEIYMQRAEQTSPRPDISAPVVSAPVVDSPVPILPEKMRKKKDSVKGEEGEVYGKRPEISAPTLQRTSAVLDVTVEAGEGASRPEPTGVKTSPPTTSPASTSPQSTLNVDRKQRPRSEISTSKTGTLRRKPDSAPPPPPPEGSRRLSAADVSPSEDLTKRLSRASSEDMTMKSQSLPRTGPTHPREPVLGGTLGRQTQRPKGRQFRANTLSEGVPCEPEDPNSVSKHETLTDLSMEITKKFSQRKLPSPPREEETLPENYYETVHSEEEDTQGVARSRKRDAVSQLKERDRRDRSATPYEDMSDEDSDLGRRAGSVGRGGSPARSKVNGATEGVRRQSLEPTQNPVMTSSAEYLQPVLHDHSPEDQCMGLAAHVPGVVACPGPAPGVIGGQMAAVPLVMNLSGSAQFDAPDPGHIGRRVLPTHHTAALSDQTDWRPQPIPRKKGSPTSTASSYVVLYSDSDNGDSRVAGFSPLEGWVRLSDAQASTLEQIRMSLDSMFVGAPASPTNLRWEDFTLESFVPVYSNVGISFYRATTNRLSIKECLLMLSLCPLPTEVATQPHLGILHPSALYQDQLSATLFPDVSSDPRVYGQCGKVPTTVWVLPFASVCSFEEYCIGLRGLYATKLPVYHRYLCSAFQQALSAILYLLNRGCCLQCFQADEILGVTPDGEQEPFVLVLPHHCHVGAKPAPREPFVGEINRLLLQLLDDRKLASACGVSLSQSRFYRGLYQVSKVLNRNTTPTLFKAQLMCEFMLWGPGEQQLRAILCSPSPQAALDVWLQLERARVIARFAIEDFVATKEDAHRVHFLVAATDQTLCDTAQLLQES